MSGDPRAGFTLVELLVSLMIFSVSMGVVSQLFTFSLKAERMLASHAQLVNEMSYNMEHISRGLRMAKKSKLTDPACLSAENINYETTTHVYGSQTTYGIKFQNPTMSGTVDCVEYYMGYVSYPGKAVLMERRSSNGVFLYDLPMNSPAVELLHFNISGTGWPQEDELQPRVTIYIETKGKEGQILKIQTTVSQRNLDIRN